MTRRQQMIGAITIALLVGAGSVTTSAQRRDGVGQGDRPGGSGGPSGMGQGRRGPQGGGRPEHVGERPEPGRRRDGTTRPGSGSGSGPETGRRRGAGAGATR